MAKSGKHTRKTSHKSAAKAEVQAQKARSASVSAPKDWLERPDPNAETKPIEKKIFWGIALFGLLVLLFLSLGSGINADDKFQVDYSQKLLDYYGSFGKDTSALNISAGNMHLYGGFFEVVTGAVNNVLGFTPDELAYHQIRHASSAALGWVAMLCAALFAGLIAGRRAGIITLIIMLVSPRFVGDSLMNPKDIPFAAGYIMAIYNMAAVFDKLKNPGRWNLAGLVAGLGIALGIRAGGLLSFAILAMIAGLHFLLKNGMLRAFSNRKALTKYALVTIGVAAAGYVFALLFWPYALQDPLHNPFVALSKFSELEVNIRVLFEGENVMSDSTPWNYALKWIVYTIPLLTLIGFAGGLLLINRLFKNYQPLWVYLALFAAIFPVFYVMYKNSVIHDGWRHLTFAYPPMCVVAALFWNEVFNMLPKKQAVQYSAYGVTGLMALIPAAFIVSNPAMPYVYFNELKGGISGAYGKFETDYWGISIRQGLEWMEKEGIIGPNMQETVVIATNMYYSAKQLTAKYGDNVKVRYLRWERRCDEAWDYALYPTRFIYGTTLQKGMWPPDNAIHTIEAGGVPILAILKDNGKNCALGMASLKVNDIENAIKYLKAEVENVPDNDLAWANLGQAYLNAGMLEESKGAAEKALEISPNDIQANNLVGIYFLNKNDAAAAKSQFELAIKREPSNATAWYFLGDLARTSGDNQTALNNLMKAIQVAPRFKPAYEMSAQIYESMGDNARAQQFRAAMNQIN
ncbi:MAG: tetratricopeptide repeat protein [Lewinellaceae bacterium]|nr:tetratricopeptide repeat protein [Saprospiraceae bacterium]MCB9342151.1 tetratricopeptide repeat protein [Lewinellaceae bacterium]